MTTSERRSAPARRASRRAGCIPTTRSRVPASATSRVAGGIRAGSISGSPNGTPRSLRPGYSLNTAIGTGSLAPEAIAA